MQRYNPKEIEPKWQAEWAKSGIYKAVDFDERPKYVMLTEFPYPSGAGIHIGHTREYTYGDIVARYKRMLGHNVLFPMGYDAFGLPTENYAIKNKVSPQQATDVNVANFQKQLESLGLSIDWSRSFRTSDPDYYKWTQWLFLQFYKAGMAYQDEIAINWCPHCKTGLSNEEVINGRHERCDTLVEKKLLKQWLLKISEYADRLIEGLKTVDYPARIADQQINWIGRSIGAEVDFPIVNNDEYVFLHGFTGSPQSDFIPALTARASSLGVPYYAPELPNTQNPSVMEQAQFVAASGKLNENSVIVAHSLGAPVALKAIELSNVFIKKLVLAAGFAQPGFADHERPFEATFDWQFNFEKVKNQIGEVIILRDSTDPAVPAERADYLVEKLGGTIVDFAAESPHICGSHEPVVVQHVFASLKVFTTRPDTIFGATFVVLAPEHPLVSSIVTEEHRAAVNTYIKAAQAKSDIERQDTDREKTGVFTGSYVINPANNAKVPIWIADYVLTGYGTGAIMAVPAHDDRDYEFATKFDLPIIRTVKNDAADDEHTHADGVLINSGKYDGLKNTDAKTTIVDDLAQIGAASKKINYRLRDWVFSRQHYWGEPIPIIHCAEHGAVAVPDDQLPVTLPAVDHYEPTDTGESPLAAITDWVNTTCPTCGKPAKRETDTMPNWAGSSWYYLRYYDAHNDQAFADPKKLAYWGAVDFYLGGMEHTTLHLLYSRFWHEFFYDHQLVPTPEPYASRRGQGIIQAADGTKMSKSKGNIVNPTDIIESGYGADALRLSIAFLAPFDQTTPWGPEGVAGTHRFLQRLWGLTQDFITRETTAGGDALDDSIVQADIMQAVHKTIKRVTSDLDSLGFNTAIAAQMEGLNQLYKLREQDEFASINAWQVALENMLQLAAPFAPHTSEELWQQLGHEDSIHTSQWPKYDPTYLLSSTVTIAVQVNGKLRGEVTVAVDADEQTTVAAAQNDAKIAAQLAGKTIQKTIYIPQKIVNFVAS
ncbi:MAG: leucine--tRNA ligase [Candidatus Saccharibacteria bacterium]|nr:leucine--tRNA ligase [Candidatus Saccharibacteria bacterium]